MPAVVAASRVRRRVPAVRQCLGWSRSKDANTSHGISFFRHFAELLTFLGALVKPSGPTLQLSFGAVSEDVLLTCSEMTNGFLLWRNYGKPGKY